MILTHRATAGGTAMKELRGKRAIVTGASRGLGVYIARSLAERGVDLALSARSADALEETRRQCEAFGVRTVAIPCDISSLDDQRRLVAEAEREFGAIDILINNAGIEYTESVVNLSFDQIDALLRTNLNAPIWLTKQVLPSMLKARRGSIVNVASLAGKSPMPFATIYATSKAGLINFTASLQSEIAGSGVKIGVVCPSFVSSAGMWAGHVAGGDVKAPSMVRAVPPQKVADAVIRCIGTGGEILVSSGPVRPLFVLAQVSPGLTQAIVKRLGVRDVFREEAERLKQGDDRKDAASREPAETR
jgi:short-subunit dehydrogenase